MKDTLDLINKQGVSIIIGARNEYPQIAMTICSLMEDMYSSGINRWEIIIMDNGSEDETSRFFAWAPESKLGRWQYKYSPRGLVSEGRLRIFYDPVFSNVGTRNRGLVKARYENVIFSDAHQIVRQGTVFNVIATLIKHGGIVHAPIAWMGASAENHSAGYQYTYKVGEKIWGTWNKTKVADEAFAIPICGHAFIAVKKDEFIRLGGYPRAQRVYGGGEPYLDTKYWMCGSTSLMEPNALVYHLSAGRGYNWHNNDLIHNMFLVSYILGGEKWADRILITYLNKPGVDKQLLNTLYNEAVLGGLGDLRHLKHLQKRTFEEVIGIDDNAQMCNTCTKRGFPDPHTMRSWDYWNEEHLGTHRSFVAEFKLHRDEKGHVYIGNTQIIDPDALQVANKYV